MRLLLITYIITFSCFDVFSSEWICDKQKSYAEGSEFYSCGSGVAQNEEKACKKALQSAHEEFMYICENSYHCKGKEKIVKPGKIKVTKKNGVYRCLREFKYKILDIKKEGISYNKKNRLPSSEDRKVTEEELQKKIKELKSLKKKLYEIKKLEALEKKIRAKKQELRRVQNKKNLKPTVYKKPSNFMEKLKDWSLLEYRQVAGWLFGFGFAKDPYYNKSFLSFEVAYRKFLFGNLSLNFFVGLGGGIIYSGKGESYDSDICYSYCSKEPRENPQLTGSMVDYFLSIPIRYRRVEFTLEKGFVDLDFDIKTFTKQGYYWQGTDSYLVEHHNYNGFGVRLFFGRGIWSVAYRERVFKNKKIWSIVGSIGF